MALLGEMTTSELICGETESLEIGDRFEITVMEIDGDHVVLRITEGGESKLIVVRGINAE